MYSTIYEALHNLDMTFCSVPTRGSREGPGPRILPCPGAENPICRVLLAAKFEWQSEQQFELIQGEECQESGVEFVPRRHHRPPVRPLKEGVRTRRRVPTKSAGAQNKNGAATFELPAKSGRRGGKKEEREEREGRADSFSSPRNLRRPCLIDPPGRVDRDVFRTQT